MRFGVGDGKSARWHGVAPGIALVALALAGPPALAETDTTDTTGTALHPTHHVWRHHAHRARTLERTEPSSTATQPQAAGQSPGLAKPTARAEATSPAAAGTTTATEPKVEAPKPAPEPKSPPQAKSEPPAAAPAEPSAAASLLDPKVAQGYVGQPVYGRKGEKLGELSQVTTGPDGKVKSATISWGGWFGYFQSHRTVDWASTDPTLKNGKLVMGAITLQQMRNGEQPQASR